MWGARFKKCPDHVETVRSFHVFVPHATHVDCMRCFKSFPLRRAMRASPSLHTQPYVRPLSVLALLIFLPASPSLPFPPLKKDIPYCPPFLPHFIKASSIPFLDSGKLPFEVPETTLVWFRGRSSMGVCYIYVGGNRCGSHVHGRELKLPKQKDT